MKKDIFFIDKGDCRDENLLRMERNGELYDIASFAPDETDGDDMRQFVKKACNSYYELLDALKIANEYVLFMKGMKAIGEIDKDIVKIKSAITKAENR